MNKRQLPPSGRPKAARPLSTQKPATLSRYRIFPYNSGQADAHRSTTADGSASANKWHAGSHDRHELNIASIGKESM
jgi:hypothetical protein